MDPREDLEIETVRAWIAVGWIAAPAGGELSELDRARARLIHDLKHNLGVNDEGVPIILDLIDQLHGLRSAMRELARKTRP